MSGSGVYPLLFVILVPEYFSSNLGDLLIISVTGNCFFLFISKNNSSSRNPATGNRVHPVSFSIKGEIVLKFGNTLLGIERAFSPSKYSLEAY